MKELKHQEVRAQAGVPQQLLPWTWSQSPDHSDTFSRSLCTGPSFGVDLPTVFIPVLGTQDPWGLLSTSEGKKIKAQKGPVLLLTSHSLQVSEKQGIQSHLGSRLGFCSRCLI